MFAIAVLALVVCFPSIAAAQTTTFDPNRGNITFTSNFDFVNAYMFRGLRQDDTRLIMWPSVDGDIRLQSGTGSVKRADLHVGSWNSLHTGLAGSSGPNSSIPGTASSPGRACSISWASCRLMASKPMAFR